jgi:rod shape-determining protein MreD
MLGRRSATRSGRSAKAINRAPSPLLARAVPWLSVILASIVPSWLVISSAPVLPPFGFLLFVSWMQLRPGLLPVWAGLPLGLVDDLYSGQPLGSAILLWSVAAIALDIIEARLPWRNFLMEGIVAAGFIAAYILLALGIANVGPPNTPVHVILPQVAVSIFLYPLVGRLIAALDRFRLTPFVEIG